MRRIMITLGCALSLGLGVSAAFADGPAPGAPPPAPNCTPPTFVPGQPAPPPPPECMALRPPECMPPAPQPGATQPPPPWQPPPHCFPGGAPPNMPGPPCGPAGGPGNGPGPGQVTKSVEPPAGPGNHPPCGPGGPGGPGDFDSGFFNRIWKLTGTVLGTDTIDGKQVIEVDVSKLLNPPKRFKDEGEEVADQGALLIVTPKVKITKGDKRLTLGDLDADDKLKVSGKFVRGGSWLKDEDGQPVPTLRAKRIEVIG